MLWPIIIQAAQPAPDWPPSRKQPFGEMDFVVGKAGDSIAEFIKIRAPVGDAVPDCEMADRLPCGFLDGAALCGPGRLPGKNIALERVEVDKVVGSAACVWGCGTGHDVIEGGIGGCPCGGDGFMFSFVMVRQPAVCL